MAEQLMHGVEQPCHSPFQSNKEVALSWPGFDGFDGHLKGGTIVLEVVRQDWLARLLSFA
jgi:hypothetical protein